MSTKSLSPRAGERRGQVEQQSTSFLTLAGQGGEVQVPAPPVTDRYAFGSEFDDQFDAADGPTLDDAYRALVTPEMIASLSPLSRRGVNCLRADVEVGPIRWDRLVDRVLTLMKFDGVPLEVAVDAVARGAETRGKDFFLVWDDLYQLVREATRFRPSYGADEYDRVAREIQRKAGNSIAITRSHRFVVGGEVVSDKDMSVLVRGMLQRYDIWDATRGRQATVDARLVREVMLALRQTWCTMVAEPGATELVEMKLVEGIEVTLSPMASLCEEALEFGKNLQMPTQELKQLYLDRWQRDMVANDHAELRRIARLHGVEIAKSQPWMNGERVPVLLGVGRRAD